MGLVLINKLAQLRELLQAYGKVAVAFSGGVDSTLLLRVACDTLGPENVTALHAVSCLTPVSDQIKAERLVTGPDGINCPYLAVKVHPLHWPEFVANSEQRCYFCKKKIYSAFHTLIKQAGHAGHSSHPSSASFEAATTGGHASSIHGARDTEPSLAFASLVDGTNTDDLQAHRPGLQAIRELSVGTPLVQAGLDKRTIRSLARQMGLTNFNQPSNSCLATRIPVHQEITLLLIERIGQAEQFLHNKGFLGCRVKPGQHTIGVHVMASDLEQMIEESSRLEITAYLKTLGFDDFFLDIQSRDTF